MSKFSIECPKCGQYAQAKTGLLAARKIECSCGNVIHIKTDKYVSRQCNSCGNVVLVDISDGRSARCPVCRKKINRKADNRALEFPCGQCGVLLQAPRHMSTHTCPICGFENDIALMIKRDRINSEGLASIIKYEGDNETLVWKHPIEDFNLGSQLIVHESQEAIFFRDGQALDLFGAGRYTLETQQLPILEKFYSLPTDTEDTFHSEVYYINMTTQMGIKWGTDTKVRLFDPMSGMHVELGASGEFNIRVANSRKLLLKLVGTTASMKQEDLLGGNGKGFFRSMVMTQVKSFLASAIRENGINVLEIDERLMQLSEALRDKINTYLTEYGLEMPEFFVSRVVTPDDDPSFRRMKEQFAEQYLLVRQEQIRKSEAEAAAQRMTVEAQAAAQLKIIGAQGEAEALRIQRQAEAEAYRMQAAAEAEEMRMKGYSQRDIIQADVQKAYADALGQMSSNGGGSGGMLSDVAGLGVTLGAMGGVIGMTKEAMSPMMDMGTQMGQMMGGAMPDGWDCACGQKGITTNFCPNCGTKKPQPQRGWNCACGQQGITSNFCSNCGAKKPEEPKSWNCACGQQGITSNFCPNCGAKKLAETWDCACGQKEIKTNFCPNCGSKRGE